MKAAITRQEIKKMERTAERGKWVGLIKLGDIPAFARWHTFSCFREDDNNE